MRITIHGTDRQAGAIGIMEKWAFETEAETVGAAVSEAVKARYADNREHVLPMRATVSGLPTRTLTLDDLKSWQ